MARSGRLWWLPLLVGLIAVVAAAIVASVLLGERSERVERAELESVSTRFAEALLTYDSSNLELARNRMRPLATEKFFKNYEGTLQALADINSRADGRATEVLVGRPRDNRVTVVVVTDSTAQTPNGPRAQRGTYLRLDLVLGEGGWQVDQVIELASGRSEGAAPPTED